MQELNASQIESYGVAERFAIPELNCVVVAGRETLPSLDQATRLTAPSCRSRIRGDPSNRID
jgi:hypothetical protein